MFEMVGTVVMAITCAHEISAVRIIQTYNYGGH